MLMFVMETSKHSVAIALNQNVKFISSSKILTKINHQFHFPAKIHYLEGGNYLKLAKSSVILYLLKMLVFFFFPALGI